MIRENVAVVVNMTLSLSSMYRIVQLANQIWQRELNASIKDFDAKMSSVGNLLYTVLVMYINPESATAELRTSLIIALLMLLRQMVQVRRPPTVAALTRRRRSCSCWTTIKR